MQSLERRDMSRPWPDTTFGCSALMFFRGPVVGQYLYAAQPHVQVIQNQSDLEGRCSTATECGRLRTATGHHK